MLTRQASMLAVGESRAHSRRSAVADARTALPADVLVVLLEIPKTSGPGALEIVVGNERPVFILDLRPQLGGHDAPC